MSTIHYTEKLKRLTK